MMVLVELRTYSNTLGDSTARQFCHMQPSALAHVEATMGDMFGAIRAVVVMPDSFAAAMRDFERFCVDPSEYSQ